MTHFLPSNDPLTDEEMDFLTETLSNYGNDYSIIDVSGLDGFLTAIVSGPQIIMPSQWYPAIWAGEENAPAWKDKAEASRFMQLVFQRMNNCTNILTHYPDLFDPIFLYDEEQDVFIIDEWCFGYMHGVALSDWTGLPPEMQAHLDVIALYGLDENFEEAEKISLKERKQYTKKVFIAACALHAYYLHLRQPAPIKREAKPGRNDPCPCGSGKKYKKCCLH